MPACCPGDKVVCPLKDGKIVSVYEMSFDTKEIFEIICMYDEGYLIYVPHTSIVGGMFCVDIANYKKYGLDIKYVNSNVCYISDYKIAAIHEKADGISCIECKEFFPMASSNKDDGTFLCWACRMYPIYN